MARKAVASARAMKKAAKVLTAAQFSDTCRFTEAELAALKKISTGVYVRNASAIIRAFEVRAGYAYGKPKDKIEHSGEVTHAVRIERIG